MKLKDYKFQKEEDIHVFKVILRLVKELGRLKKNKDLSLIIEQCYYSRQSHPRESFATNISYWPSDCNLFGYPRLNLLYLSMLINRLSKEHRDKLYPKLMAELRNIVGNPLSSTDIIIEGFEQEISNALIKCGVDEKKAIKMADNLYAIKEGVKHNIPF
jgi:hypothetical protein